MHTEREERRIWLMMANFSSVGKRFESSNIIMLSAQALL